MLKCLKVLISLDQYQCENEKKSYSNQIKVLIYAKKKQKTLICIYVNCQLKTWASMITKDTRIRTKVA